MHIKRNVKKLATDKAVNTTTQKTLRYTGFGKYNLPTYDKVPAGAYFSEVINAKFTTTKAGTPAIEALYEMNSGPQCWQVINGRLPEDTELKVYYVKQIYPKNTTYYDDFVDSMGESLGLYNGEEFTLEDIKGITEYVEIGYEGKCNLGGIQARCPLSWEEFLDIGRVKPDDEEEEVHEDNEHIEENNDAENKSENVVKQVNEQDEDDEFDDFWDDVDDSYDW